MPKPFIHLIFLISIFNPSITIGGTLDEMVAFLTTKTLTEQTPKQIESMNTPWGKPISQEKSEEEGWLFSTNKSPYYLDIVFANAEQTWLFNDASISIYTDTEQCVKNLVLLKDQFIGTLGTPKAQNEEGYFWQLSQKEWGIWVSQVETLHPKTHESTCAVKAVLAYGADEYLSEDGAF